MKFVANAPAAVIGKSLVVADVHLGIEYELEARGIRLSPRPKEAAFEFNALLHSTGTEKLVVLGDFKHDCRGFEEREKRMMREFLARLEAQSVTVCKGNHDSQLEQIKGIGLAGPGGFVLRAGGKSYGCHHGHAWPAKELLAADVLLMGNNHPTIAFVDGVGARHEEKAWVKGRLKASKLSGARRQEAIVFPAYSRLSGGIAFNTHSSKQLLGPLFKNELFDLENAEAFLLNGVRLGCIKNLRN